MTGIDEPQLPVVAKREGGHGGGDAAAAQHVKERVVRAVTSRLRRCGDWATKAVGDRDGKSSDDTSRHPSRPQHRSADVHAAILPEPDPGGHVVRSVNPRVWAPVVEAALLAVEDSEAAADGQAARQTRWWCFPCARSAGSPTTPGGPNT